MNELVYSIGKVFCLDPPDNCLATEHMPSLRLVHHDCQDATEHHNPKTSQPVLFICNLN